MRRDGVSSCPSSPSPARFILPWRRWTLPRGLRPKSLRRVIFCAWPSAWPNAGRSCTALPLPLPLPHASCGGAAELLVLGKGITASPACPRVRCHDLNSALPCPALPFPALPRLTVTSLQSTTLLQTCSQFQAKSIVAFIFQRGSTNIPRILFFSVSAYVVILQC